MNDEPNDPEVLRQAATELLATDPTLDGAVEPLAGAHGGYGGARPERGACPSGAPELVGAGVVNAVTWPLAVPLILAVCFCALAVCEGRAERRERNER